MVMAAACGVATCYAASSVGSVHAGQPARRRRVGVGLRQRGAVLWGARLRGGENVRVPDAPFVHVFFARGAGRLEGAGTLSWDGATGVWWWMDPTNDVIFMGMIQNSYRAGPRGYGDFARQLVYQALVDPNWAGFPAEVYLFAAFVYFCFCFSMSRYAKHLEIELNKGTRR